MRLYDLSPEVGGMSFTLGRKVYMDTGGQGGQLQQTPTISSQICYSFIPVCNRSFRILTGPRVTHLTTTILTTCPPLHYYMRKKESSMLFELLHFGASVTTI